MSMVKLKINNTEYQAEEGTTILEMAGKAGILIPTLCHKDGVEHYTSCMVCMVKERNSNRFIPSCSSLAQDGMDIDASGEEVIDLRKKSVELLLSEHRAECEAPCMVVCPAGYNIPLMNRYLFAKDFDSASSLTLSEINTPQIACINCRGYCENACRRKKVDNPVSIRNIKIFIAKTSLEENPARLNTEAGKPVKEKKRFLSQIGKMDAEELNEYLKECEGDLIRHREINDFLSAASETGSCMHCDCRAADNCRLRDIAGELSVKDPKGKLVYAPIAKKINRTTGLVFENAKCIKCGLCVRICEDSTNEPALCFISRGFISIISEPLTENFDNVLKNKAAECIRVCPTGALSDYNALTNNKK